MGFVSINKKYFKCYFINKLIFWVLIYHYINFLGANLSANSLLNIKKENNMAKL